MKRLLMVVGMHRSGTSCLTGMLGDADVWLGPVEKGSPHNVKGNNENRQVMNLNKAVLAANNASWDYPPAHDAIWTPEQLERADELLDDLLAPDRITAMKDPRSLYTGHGWTERAREHGASILRVGTFRRPERVVASLRARDDTLDPETCVQLWDSYNRRLLALHDEQPFPLLDFDSEPDEYLRDARSAFEHLGLVPPEELPFFETGLRHQSIDQRLSKEIEATYDRLCEIVETNRR